MMVLSLLSGSDYAGHVETMAGVRTGFSREQHGGELPSRVSSIFAHIRLHITHPTPRTFPGIPARHYARRSASLRKKAQSLKGRPYVYRPGLSSTHQA